MRHSIFPVGTLIPARGMEMNATGKEHTNGKMDQYTKVNGSLTLRTDTVGIPGPTEKNMKDNGKKIICTDEESGLLPTETLITEITKWTKCTDMES